MTSGQPALGAQAVAVFDRRADLGHVAALIAFEGRQIEDRRLAPRLARGRGVERALGEDVVVSRAELFAQLVRGETGQERMLGMLRRRVSEDCEAGHRQEELVRVVLVAKIADCRASGVVIAFDQSVVEHAP